MPRIVTFSPITAGAVTDSAVWESAASSFRVNNLQGVRARWGLMTGCIDPRWPFANCDGSIEAQGPVTGVTQSLAATSEAGISGPDAVVRFGKVADPDNAAKSAYIIRFKQGDDAAMKRTELSFSSSFTPVPLARTCWIGFATRIPEAWRGLTGTDEVMLFQVHDTPDAGDENQPAPIGLVVRGARLYAWVRHNPNLTTLAAGTTYIEVFSETAWPGDQWQFWAFRLKSSWDSAQSPRLEAWRRVGTGPTVKVIDHSGPNSYNDVTRDYCKSGLYYYADQWTDGVLDKVLYHKGLYQWLDGMGLTEELILDHLQSI